MESVLHDVPLAPPGLIEWAGCATSTSPRSVRAARLRELPQPRPARLDVERARLVDSLPACYPQTRAWAQAAFSNARRRTARLRLAAQRRARCLMLFGQRLPAGCLKLLADEPLACGARRAEFLALARSLEIHEV